MANSFNIPEVTLLQIADSTHAINAGTRLDPLQPLVCRVLGHVNDSGAACTTEALLDSDAAIFMSKGLGYPWTLGGSKDHAISSVIHDGTNVAGAAPANSTVIYPDFDYSTFE